MGESCVCSETHLNTLIHKHLLVKRLLFNVLDHCGGCGPLNCLDLFWLPDFRRSVLYSILVILRGYVYDKSSLRLGDTIPSVQLVTTYWSMIPYGLVIRLQQLFGLQLELFSDVINNNFRKFCVGPECQFPQLAYGKDGFVTLGTILQSNQPVRILANPPFLSAVVGRLLNMIRVWHATTRHQADLFIVYIGPAHPLLHTGLQEGWAMQLGALGACPFVHPRHGMMGPLLRPLQMWCLGNASTLNGSWTQIAVGLRPCERLYSLTLSTALYTMAARGFPRAGLGSRVCCLRHPILQQKLSDMHDLVYSVGRMNTRDLYMRHQAVVHVAHGLKHPTIMHLCSRYGATVLPTSQACPVVPTVYIIVCLQCHLLYVGSSINGFEIRYREHIRKARRHLRVRKNHYVRLDMRRHMCRSVGALRHENVYTHMVRCGVEMSVGLVVQMLPNTVTILQLRQLEWRWMGKFEAKQLLNVRVPMASKFRVDMRSLCIRRQDASSPYTEEMCDGVFDKLKQLGVAGFVEYVCTMTRCPWDPRVFLRVHRYLAGFMSTHSEIMRKFRVILTKRLRSIPIHLPSTMVIRVWHPPPGLRVILKRHIRDYLNEINVHSDVIAYYMDTLSIVGIAPPSLGQLFFNMHRHLSNITWKYLLWNESIEHSGQPCSCHCEDTQFRPGSRHVLFRFRDIKHPCKFNNTQITADMLRLLQSSMGSVPPTSFHRFWIRLRDELIQFNRVIYNPDRVARLGKFLATLSTDLFRWWKSEQFGNPIVSKTVYDCRLLLQDYVVGPCDKDPTTMWICCRRYYYHVLFQKFFASEALGGFQVRPTIHGMMDDMSQAIRSSLMSRYASRLGLKSLDNYDISWVPRLFIIFKKRCFPDCTEVAVRPITSHAKHVCKRGCRRLGRALSTVLGFLHKAFAGVSRECTDMQSAPAWWRQLAQNMDVTISEGFPGDSENRPGTGQNNVRGSLGLDKCWIDDNRLTDYKLFEYDVKDMYFRIPVDEALDAIEACLKLAKERFGRRWVAVNRLNRADDRMGTGSEQLFWNVRLDDIYQFVKFELKGNHFARVGYVGYAQSRGVPMGGEASAQIAAAYCLTRDIKSNICSQCHGFTFFRFRDNLPGILNIHVTSVEEVGQFFERVYELPMKLESVGSKLTTLEMEVALVGSTIGFYMKPQFYDILQHGLLDKAHKLPAPWSLNCTVFMQSAVPSALLKCVTYASSVQCQYIGVINCIFGYILSGLRWSRVLFRLLRYAVLRRLPKHVYEVLSYLLRKRLDYFPP